MMRTSLLKQRGQFTLIMALSMTTLLGVMGLAIDTGISYTIKSKLNAATDSASLAAANAVTNGNDQVTQAANARAAAVQFFNANFPSGYMGATATLNTPQVTFNSGTVTIDVSASASMPVSLLGVLKTGPLAPGVTSETIRKDLDMVLVMDTSGSLSDSATAVRAAAITFLNKFNPTTDRVSLLRFAYGSVVDDAIRTGTLRGFDRPTMTSQINNYSFSGSTASSEGLWQARAQLNSIALLNRSSMRVVVFFSDGAPNSVASFFPYKVASDCIKAGTVTTGDDTTVNTPDGLYDPSQISTLLGGKCVATAKTSITGIPAWYNAHNNPANPNDPTLQEFPLVTNSPRVVTNDVSSSTIYWKNINRASRNMAEALANNLRSQNIIVFTLGLGAQLTQGTGPDNEMGQDVLKCMANSTDAPTRCVIPTQPVGLYCYAATTNDLTPCFSKLASAILRISK